MKKDLDSLLDLSSDEIRQEGDELFDGILYAEPTNRLRDVRRGFVEDLEAKVDRILAEEEQEELNLLMLVEEEDDLGEDGYE